MNPINIAIVDDQNLFRQSLGLLIDSVEEFKLVGDYPGGNEFIDALPTLEAPVHVAIIDMDMPGMNGIELNKHLHLYQPQIKVIILSVHVNEMLISRMINAGAASYLAKNCDKDELVIAINTVCKTGFYFNNDAVQAIRNTAHQRMASDEVLNNLPIPLTKREIQIMQMICREFNNAEIARELYLSVRTVEGHRTSIIGKINCRNTAGLVLFAIKHNLVELSI